MADTTRLKTVIEPYVRSWLSQRFGGQAFEEKPIILTGGGRYSCDAVSEDGSIIAAVLSNRAATRTGRENTGGVRKALTEIGYLKAAAGRVRKLMVFTDDGFCQLIKRRANRIGMDPIEMVVCTLPPHLEALRSRILDESSHEQRAAE